MFDRRSAIALSCLVATVAAPPRSASADADSSEIVRFASIEVSRWSDPGVGYDELREGPGAIRDDDPSTAWEARADARGEAWILLDWAAAEPFALDEVVVAIEPADAAITLDAGLERTRLATTNAVVSRAADGVHLRSDTRLRALRLHIPVGARVSSIAVRARAGAGAVTATGTCDATGVHLEIAAPGALGLRITRRDADGRAVEIVRRETTVSRFDDPSVRYRTRPATYTYEVASLLPVGKTVTSISCEGAPPVGPTTTALHGVVEGFYGRPWSFRDRAKVVRAMAAFGLDPYIYAPKDAPKHRAKWRVPYDEAELAELRALAAVGAASGVRVVYAISPGLDVDAAAPADRDALVAKIAQLRRGGVRDAALLMDDISAPPSTALGAAHASLAEVLLGSMRAADPAAQLLFVPTVYAGAASKLKPAELEYLAALAALPADVPLAWTGSAVFTPSFDRSELEAFAQLAARTAEGAWVWDNYPVNDLLASGRLYPRPVEGRGTLYDRTGGLVANAMRHPIASIPALASFGALARDPARYEAARAADAPFDEAALARAVMDDGEPPASLPVLLDELHAHPYLAPDDLASPALTAALARYAAGADPQAASLALATHLARLALVDVDLRRELHDASLADELDGYARVTAVSARAALLAMTHARRPSPSSGGSATEAACLAQGLKQLAWQTIQRAVQPLIPAADGECPDLDDPFDPVAPTQILPAKTATLDASRLADGSSGSIAWSVVGPADATIDGAGHVSWKPARLGRYRLVALAVDARGAGARVFDVVVGEPLPSAPEEHAGCGCRVGQSTTTPAWIALLLLFGLCRCSRRT